jgi:hypothetical protein
MKTTLRSSRLVKYKPGTHALKTLCLFMFSLAVFSQKAGAQAGASSNGQTKVTICHKGKVTITIAQSALAAHLAHGDKIGSCDVTPPCSVTATGGVITCASPNVTLKATSTNTGISYSWTGPNGFTSTVANPVVSVPGIYSVTVSSTSCTAFSDTALVTKNITAPVVTATGGTITCKNSSVTLSATSSISGSKFSWTGPNGFTSTAVNPTVQAPGTYVVTATNPATGCTASNAAVVQQNLTAPAILTIQSSSGSATITCSNPSVVLTATTNATDVNYKWTGPNNFVSTSPTPSVSEAGTYQLQLSSNSNGCSSTASIEIMKNTTAPAQVSTIPAVMGTITCSQPSLVLTGGSATPGVRYNWTGPNGFASLSSTTTATVPGVYTLTVTDTSNGCGSQATVNVQQNITAPVGVTASNSEALTCFTTEVSLLGSSSSEAVSYSWSGPGGFTSASPITTTSVGGTYTLTVKDLFNGCTSSATTTVEQHTTPPADVTAQASGVLSCNNISVTLQATSSTTNVDYNWFGPDGFFASSAQTTTEYPGDYMLMVTDRANGCSVIMNTTVEQDFSDCQRAAMATSRASGNQTAVAASNMNTVQLNAYPNPVHGKGFISFQIPENGNATVKIYSVSGAGQQMLFNQQAQAHHLYQLPLDASKLTKGVYYCVVTVNNKQYSKKIVVMP